MTWDINNFVTLSRYVEGDTVTFRDDSKGTIICTDNIKIGTSPLIENVVLVDGLKHNLLGISQLCDRGLKIIFDESSCNIFDCKTKKCILTGFRENNVYIFDMLNLDCTTKCLNAFDENSWLWHRSLGHTSFDHLFRINSKELVKGIPYLKFEKDRICGACQLEKQTKSSFKPIKDIMTSRPLELIHMIFLDQLKLKA